MDYKKICLYGRNILYFLRNSYLSVICISLILIFLKYCIMHFMSLSVACWDQLYLCVWIHVQIKIILCRNQGGKNVETILSDSEQLFGNAQQLTSVKGRSWKYRLYRYTKTSIPRKVLVFDRIVLGYFFFCI